MTKDVLITISGIQTIDGEVNDPIETVTPGEYYFRNGKHYILYDEVQEGVPGVTKCMIKIGEDAVDLSKKGNAGVHMSFQKDKKTRTSVDVADTGIYLSFFPAEPAFGVGSHSSALRVEHIVGKYG